MVTSNSDPQSLQSIKSLQPLKSLLNPSLNSRLKQIWIQKPQDIVSLSCDCLWVILAPRTEPNQIRSAALQWVDWKMRGKLSALILQKPNESATNPSTKREIFPHLFYTSHGIAASYLSIVWGNLDWELLLATVKGMKFNDVHLLFEEIQKSEVEGIQNEWQMPLVPANVSLVLESYREGI